MKKRLTAFTIPELMVVMLLSGIVISAMYLLLEFSFTNYFRYFISTGKLNSISRMDYLLTKDINTSAVLQKTENGFSFTEHNKIIEYKILDSLLIRTDQFTDTMIVNQIQYELLWNNVPLLSSGEVGEHLMLTITYKGEELVMHYQKHIDAKGYLLMEENYGNTNK